jgi:hypothetical protein
MCLFWFEKSKVYQLLNGKGDFMLYAKSHPDFSKAARFVSHKFSGKLYWQTLLSFAGRYLYRDAALDRARHMALQASSTRDSTQWDVSGCGATILEEGVASADRLPPCQEASLEDLR